MNRFYTTVEESKHLLELGLSADTADMFWPNAPITVPCVKDGNPMGVHIPCWSLSALLEMMPRWIRFEGKVADFILEKNPDGRYSLSYSNTRSSKYTFNESLIEASYSMVCDLLEHNYIKKG